LGALGVGEAVAYHASKEVMPKSDALRSALLIGLAQSLLLVLVGLVVIPFVLAGKPGEVLHAALVYLLVIPLHPLTLYPLAVLQGRLSFGAFNLARVVVHVAYTGLVAAIWLLGGLDVFTAMAASLLATLGGCIVTIYLAWAKGYFRWKSAPLSLRPLLRFGTKIHMGNVAGIVSGRLDFLFLSYLPLATVLGHYAVATAVASGLALVPNAAGLLLYPAFSRDASQDRPRRLSRVLLLGALLTIVLLPLGLILVPPLLPTVFGTAFQSAVPIAEILMGGYLLRGWAAMLTAVVRGAGHPLTASFGDVLNLVTFVPLLIVLVLPASGIGAAVALSAAAAVQVTWLGIQAFRLTGLSIGSMFETWKVDFKSLRTQE
jgi:O-antigen/teichoic acid export membrane protein